MRCATYAVMRCLSVCLTRSPICIETNEHIPKLFTPSGSPAIVVFPCQTLYHFISEMIQDRAIVTVERQYELVCDRSNGALSNDLEWLVRQISRSRHYLRLDAQKRWSRCCAWMRTLAVSFYSLVNLCITSRSARRNLDYREPERNVPIKRLNLQEIA